MSQTDSKLILSPSLKAFFFDSLSTINAQSVCPMPDSLIYYSSELLERLSLSEDYFEVQEGKVKEKILGLKLLESRDLSHAEQVRVLRDVADTALLVSGYFSDSIKKKIVDPSYYIHLGKNSYERLNNLSPQYLDIPSFYHMLATGFDGLSLLLKKFSIETFQSQSKNSSEQFFQLGRKVS